MLRRYLLSSMPALLTLGGTTSAASIRRQRLGLAIQSYSHRWHGNHSSIKHPAFKDVLDVMDHGQQLGIGSLQIDVADWNRDLAGKVRASSESYDIKVEGSIRLPQAVGDLERFSRELKIGKEAGIQIFHAVLGGTRYEVFIQKSDFDQWKSGLRRTLELAETAARKLGVRIALENSQDLQTTEWIELLKSLSSAQMGLCLDTGNQLGLLENPLEAIRQLAAFTITVRLRDLAVHQTEEGFEMASVPLGQGILDLPETLCILRSESPQAEYHLQMPTCDPQLVPCLKDSYWQTMPEKSGLDLARTLTMIQKLNRPRLPQISSISAEGKLILEEKNILESFNHAGTVLGFYKIQIIKAQAEDH